MNTCLNCRFAEWERTKTGRLHPSGEGECMYRPPQPVLPEPVYCLVKPLYRSACLSRRNPETDCPCWAAKGEE